MKYAFIFASNIYMSQQPTVSYADNDTTTEFLKVLTFKRNIKHDQHHTALAVDANVNLEDGSSFKITNNVLDGGLTGYELHNQEDKVCVMKNDTVFFEVHQLPEADWDTLQTHILNEIQVQEPEAVFIVRGDFWVNGHHIIVDSEKLFVDNDSYATGVTNDHGGVMLKPYDEDNTSY